MTDVDAEQPGDERGRAYVFAGCRLEPDRFELWRADQRVAIQPKPFALLLTLLRRRARTVSKRELMQLLWPDVVVGESSLTRVVSLARAAIGDPGGERAVIGTYPRRGYRLCAEVALIARAETGQRAERALPQAGGAGDPVESLERAGVAPERPAPNEAAAHQPVRRLSLRAADGPPESSRAAGSDAASESTAPHAFGAARASEPNPATEPNPVTEPNLGVGPAPGSRPGAVAPRSPAALDPIEALDAESRELLICAAVAGLDLRLAKLAAMSDCDLDALSERLETAVRSGWIGQSEPAGRYRLSDPSLARRLYEATPQAARRELHRRAAEWLERSHVDDRFRVAVEIAEHRFEAALGPDERAVASLLAAGEQALGQGDPPTAVTCYARARSLIELEIPVPAARLLEVQLALGDACRAAGDATGRREAFASAVALARALGRPDDLARAALGHLASGEWRSAGPQDQAFFAEALAGDCSPALRARVLSRLAHAPPPGRSSAALCSEAIHFAERSGDPEACCEARHAEHYLLEGPDHIEARAVVADLIRESGRASGRDDLVLEIHLEQMADRLLVGDRAGAERELGRAARLAARIEQGWSSWLVASARTGLWLLHGDTDRAETELARAARLGEPLDNPGAASIRLLLQATFARAVGDHAALGAAISRHDMVRADLGLLPRAVGAGCLLELGRDAEARAALVVACSAVPQAARNLVWLPSLVELAHVAAACGDRAQRTLLRDALAPYAHLHAVLPYAVAYRGPVAFALCALSTSLHDVVSATALATRAHAAAERVGAIRWCERIRAAYPEVDPGGPPDPRIARIGATDSGASAPIRPPPLEPLRSRARTQ